MIPTREDNPGGLHQRYRVEKVCGRTDPDAVYLVLRLDNKGDDPAWTKACRMAARQLALQLQNAQGALHLRQMGRELQSLVSDIEKGKK